VEARAVSSGGGVHPFYRAGVGVGASAGNAGINADRFGIERKKGGSGEGRRFRGGSLVAGAPAMEKEGGWQGGRDGIVRRCPTVVVAQSYLTGGRRRPAGPSGPKGFLGWTVLLGRNHIKSFLNFYLNSGIWQDFENLYKEI
jgi:hypothetical protein